MKRLRYVLLTAAIVTSLSARGAPAQTVASRDYADLVSLYQEAREALKPKLRNGVPDYAPATMEARKRAVQGLRRRLDSIDSSGWPVGQRVDYLLLRAQMDGLDFEHRVLRPWSRDPGFYLTDAAIGAFSRSNAPASLDTPGAVADFRARVQAVPALLEQAKTNLTEGARELAQIALRARIREFEFVSRDLAVRLRQQHPDLIPDLEKARAAIEGFRDWLGQNLSRMSASAGVGADHYDWYLKRVALLPYSIHDVRVIAEREYERFIAFLKIEENRNRKLARLDPAANETDFRRRVQEADRHILEFMGEEGILTAPASYVPAEPEPLWVVRPGPNERPNGERNFFQQGEDRDPRPLQLHITVPGHHFDGVMARRDERVIRAGPPLYRIGNVRTEGWAFYVEEMMSQAGLYERSPRTREIGYIYQAMRAARTMAELHMQKNEYTYEETLRFMARLAPRWLHEDDPDLVDELGGYLRHPTAGVAYLIGKVQIEQLLSDRVRQVGERFNLGEFHDQFLAAGRIPVSLIRWEMMGVDDQVKELW